MQIFTFHYAVVTRLGTTSGILFNKMYLFHHGVGTASAVGAIASQSSAYAIFFHAFAECSTIFFSLGWFLKKVHGKSSTLYKICSILFTMTFIFNQVPACYMVHPCCLPSTCSLSHCQWVKSWICLTSIGCISS